jgi:hypothetical protein
MHVQSPLNVFIAKRRDFLERSDSAAKRGKRFFITAIAAAGSPAKTQKPL